MRVIIYIRVSTKMQASEDKYSLRAQKTELLAYSKKMNWTVTDIITDIDSGGKFEKKGLETVMDLADEGKMDVVLVLDQTRLSRLDGLHWEMLKSVLKKNNVKLAEPGRLVDMNDDVQEFFSDIQNWFARRGRNDISKTMMRGKRQMLREGRPWGKVPLEYNYNKQTKEITINDDYAWTIPTIDKMYLKDQMGLKTIANKLNEIKYQPNGKPWNDTLIYRRLISKAFHGIMEKKFATGEIITSKLYPPLRTEETYKAIQQEMENRSKQYSPHFTKNIAKYIHFMRRTKLICGECGRVLGLEQHGQKKGPVYYFKHGRKRRISDQSVCDISINTVRCDHNIIQAIKDILHDENLAKKYIDLEDDDNQILVLQKDIAKTKKQVDKLNSRLTRLMDLYLDGEFDKMVLDTKKNEINNHLKKYEEQLNDYNVKLDLLEKKKWNYELIYQYLEIAKDFDTDLTALERAQLIGTLFPTATVYRDRIILHGVLEIGTTLDVEIKIDKDPYKWHHQKRKKS